MRAFLLLLTALLLAAAPGARANLCNLDDVPAATLLLPYFEVDLEDPTRMTTLFSVLNAAPEATLAKITLWSDLAVPTLDFDIYLTGYDVVTINLGDIFQGTIPQTGPDLLTPGDFSRPNAAFPECDGVLPQGQIPPLFIDHLRAAHTGRPSAVFTNRCAGVPTDDRIARGYVTIDVVRACSFLFPSDPGYFGPDGVAGYDNILWGDYFLVNSRDNFAQGENLVRIEADPDAFGEGDYTFYARYVGADGSDGREPLATTWGARYLSGGAFTGGTGVTVWRDSKVKALPFDCSSAPEGFPLQQAQIAWFDEDENVALLDPAPIPGNPTDFPPLFAFSTQSLPMGSPALPSAFDFGWIYLNLNEVEGTFLPPFGQGWVGTVHDASGLFSVGYGATALDSACAAESLILPVAGNSGGLPPGNPP